MFLFLWEAMFYVSMGAAIFSRSRKYGGPKKWRLFGRRRWRREWERVQLAPLGRCGAVQFSSAKSVGVVHSGTPQTLQFFVFSHAFLVT